MPRSQATVNTTFNAQDRMRGPMNQMQQRVTGFSRSSQRSLRGVGQSFGSMTRAVRIAGAAIVGGLIGRGISGLVSAASDIETVTTQFETLTGSVENATRLVGNLQDFAAATPLQFDTLAQGTQRLLAFGIAQDDVVNTMQTLGDAAVGDANKLDSLTRAYGKVSARGKASMEEINMVIDAGVPIMDALNEEFGTTTEELTKMISEGKVTSEVFQDAFRRMTSEGGQFHNGMQRQSQTTAGRISTLKDNMQLTAASIGTALLPTVNDLIVRLTEITSRVRSWVSENQELINQRVESVIEGISNTAKTLVRLWDNGLIPALLAGVAAFKTLMGLYQIWRARTAIMVALQATLNAVMSANPIGLIIVGISALVAAIVLLIKNWDSVTEAFGKGLDGIKAAFLSARDAVRNAWGSLLDWFAQKLQPIVDLVERTIGRVQDIGRGIGGAARGIGERIGNVFDGDNGLSSRGRATNETISRSESISRSEVGINIAGAPRGTSITQRGRAPGVSLAFGAEGGRLD